MPSPVSSVFTRALAPSLGLLACLVGASCSEGRARFEGGSAVGFVTADDGGAPAGTCVADEVAAETVPLAMLVLVDRSGSMLGERWTAATKAIRAFADRGEVAGMPMGLSFFPPLGAGDECARSSYTPLAVPIAELPENALVIQEKLASVTPVGDTPMSGALQGAIDEMRAFLAVAEPHEGVIILVTDGDPSACGSVGNVAQVASTGAVPTGTEPRVRTFAVGMQGATFANLNQIAQAGGSPSAFDVGSGTGQQEQLLAALESVRLGAIGCEFVLPLPAPDQGVLDLESVSVVLKPGKNDPEATMRKVANLAACGTTTGGFYYDDPARPSRVVLCPASCEDVRAGGVDASVKLVFGCIQRPL